MKIDVKEATVESSMSFGKSVEMGISSSGVVHLMSLLTNLYNDPETAVIREYYTNALDAHIRAKQDKTIDIFLPTHENPLFVVKDYGIGMSESFIADRYSQYGDSTKRDSNEEAGAFGLGCKSALAIATQFTLTSIKDGRKTTALISKSESGINMLDILPSKSSDEGDGTTVTIPVADVSSFNKKVKEFFLYSDPTKVRLNGHTPESVFADASELDSGLTDTKIYFRERAKYSFSDPTFKVIMGNVPYTFGSDSVRESLTRQGISFDLNQSKLDVFFVVGIGSVDLTPNREGLRYTDKTKKFVDEAVASYISAIREKALTEINAVESRSEVHSVVDKWSRLFDRKTMTWRGEVVPEHARFPDRTFKTVRRSGENSEHGTSNTIRLDNGKFTIVYGRDPEEYKKVSAYLTPYMDSEGIGQRIFYFTDEVKTIDNKWITENPNAELIEAEKLVEIGKAKRKADRAAGKSAMGTRDKVHYPVMDLATGDIVNLPYDKIDSNLPYLFTDDFSYSVGSFINDYFTGKRATDAPYEMGRRKKIADTLAYLTSAKKVVFVGGARKVSALVSRLDGTYSILVDFEKKIKELLDSVDQSVKDIESLRGTRYSAFFSLVRKHNLDGLVEDQKIRELVNPTKKTQDAYDELTKYKANLDIVCPNNRSFSIPDSSTVVQDLLIKYPLIGAVNFDRSDHVGVEHMIKYLNLIHEESLTAVS